jgi:uncharacterized integral membrane protein
MFMSSDPYATPEPPVVPADVPVAHPATPKSAVHFTRASAVWSAVIGGFLILIVLLIFIAQNTESAEFAFFGWNWSLPLGVAILLAAVCGGLGPHIPASPSGEEEPQGRPLTALSG